MFIKVTLFCCVFRNFKFCIRVFSEFVRKNFVDHSQLNTTSGFAAGPVRHCTITIAPICRGQQWWNTPTKPETTPWSWASIKVLNIKKTRMAWAGDGGGTNIVGACLVKRVVHIWCRCSTDTASRWHALHCGTCEPFTICVSHVYDRPCAIVSNTSLHLPPSFISTITLGGREIVYAQFICSIFYYL